MFQSQITRQKWLSAFLFTAGDIAIAGLIAFNFTSEPWFAFWAILAFFWLTPMVLGAKSTVYRVLSHFAFKKHNLEALKREYRKAQLPGPPEYFSSPDEYFEAVAEDQSAPDKARLFSAGTLGGLVAISQQTLLGNILHRFSLENSLTEYFDELASKQTEKTSVDRDRDSEDESDSEPQEWVSPEDLAEQDDLERLAKLKSSVNIAGMSAQNLNAENVEMLDYERARYERFRDKALALLDEIQDEFYFGAAVHQVSCLLKSAHEIDSVRPYFDRISDDFLRDRILRDCPELQEKL